MDVRKILIPTDLSEESNAALHSANVFIDLFDCKVDVMHVIPLSQYWGDSLGSIGMPLDMEDDIYPKLMENKEKELQAFANAHISNSAKKGETIITIDRKPSNSITERANKEGYDLIMLSAQGGHKSDFFHGSITDKIIRKSKVPVLTLSDNINPGDINKILVPCDFSDHSMMALPVAVEFAEKFKADIKLLHVIELYEADIHYGMVQETAGMVQEGMVQETAGVDEHSVYESLLDNIREFFKNYKKRNLELKKGDVDYLDEIIINGESNTGSVSIESHIVRGVSSHHEIADHANNEADMLVMSTHGRSGLAHMLIGSTTEQVVQQVKKPLLTIKPELEED